MKNWPLLSLLVLIYCTGCEKEQVTRSIQLRVQPASPPLNSVITGPKAFAGLDAWVPFPSDYSFLQGYTSHAESIIDSTHWKKISGPASYVIEIPGSKYTKVSNLEKGRYEFEFTVTTKASSIDKDTISIHIYEPRIAGANEYIFKTLEWGCVFGCQVFIENFYTWYVPIGTDFKVFIKTTNSDQWFELLNNKGSKYFFGIKNDKFWISTDYPDVDQNFPVDVKITY